MQNMRNLVCGEIRDAFCSKNENRDPGEVIKI